MAKFNPNSPEFKSPILNVKNIKCNPKLRFKLELSNGIRKTEGGEVVEGNYIRERSCGCCGAPIAINRTTAKQFNEASSKGKETSNFTEDELKRFYGVSFDDIDGVIYDDSGMCNSCNGYC